MIGTTPLRPANYYREVNICAFEIWHSQAQKRTEQNWSDARIRLGPLADSESVRKLAHYLWNARKERQAWADWSAAEDLVSIRFYMTSAF